MYSEINNYPEFSFKGCGVTTFLEIGKRLPHFEIARLPITGTFAEELGDMDKGTYLKPSSEKKILKMFAPEIKDPTSGISYSAAAVDVEGSRVFLCRGGFVFTEDGEVFASGCENVQTMIYSHGRLYVTELSELRCNQIYNKGYGFMHGSLYIDWVPKYRLKVIDIDTRSMRVVEDGSALSVSVVNGIAVNMEYNGRKAFVSAHDGEYVYSYKLPNAVSSLPKFDYSENAHGYVPPKPRDNTHLDYCGLYYDLYSKYDILVWYDDYEMLFYNNKTGEFSLKRQNFS